MSHDQHTSKMARNPTADVATTSQTTDSPDLAEVPPFHVVKADKFFEPPQTSGGHNQDIYETRGSKRGLFVLFMQYMDEDPNGAEEDVKNLRHLFQQIGLKVMTYVNLTKDEILSTLRNLRDMIMPDLDTLFLMVSSVGRGPTNSTTIDVRCSDRRLINPYEIFAHFNLQNCPALHGKPKVFILQVCREIENASSLDDEPYTPHGFLPERTTWDRDTLIVNSSVPRYGPERGSEKGSLYVKALCEVFAEHAHEHPVEHLFVLVDRKMSEEYNAITSYTDDSGLSISFIRHWGFHKKLYLNPGLVPDTASEISGDQ